MKKREGRGNGRGRRKGKRRERGRRAWVVNYPFRKQCSEFICTIWLPLQLTWKKASGQDLDWCTVKILTLSLVFGMRSSEVSLFFLFPSPSLLPPLSLSFACWSKAKLGANPSIMVPMSVHKFCFAFDQRNKWINSTSNCVILLCSSESFAASSWENSRWNGHLFISQKMTFLLYHGANYWDP